MNPNNQKGASMSLLRKTFFGLTFSYYFRNLIFAGIVAALQYNYQKTGTNVSTVLPMALLAANTILYPYSRFAYESVMEFFMGTNIFILPLIIMLPYKLFTIMLCWFLAPFIAPIGLIFIWFHHSKDA
jgi:hypothetical protein